MKNLIIAILAAASIITGSSIGQQEAPVNHEYPELFIVEEVNEEENYVILETLSGNQFKWNNAGDWQIGDLASAIMNSQGTETVKDDEIIMLQYSGYID